MLREVPGYHYSQTMDHTLLDADDFQPTTDALDDIFGSSPNSPLASAVSPTNIDDPDFDALDATLASPTVASNLNGERSDIPRLRSTHVTSGYRDGIAESKALFVQEGFDEGFSLGAVLGLRAGWLVGVLEGIVRAVNADAQASEDSKVELRRNVLRAREELGLKGLFGTEWFGGDGIWTFEVDGDGDGEVTFREVAAAHPIVAKWVAKVKELQEKFGLDLEVASRLEEDESQDEQASS